MSKRHHKPQDEFSFLQMMEGFNEKYAGFLQFLHGIGDVLMTLTQTIFVAFGVPVILALLLFVEQQRVKHGVEMFEVDKGLASFAAWALVLANLVLEFQVHHIEQREGYHEEQKRRFSLRVWWRDASYWLGLGEYWEERLHSPAKRYQQLLHLVTFTILALALAGSMQTIMEQTGGAWHKAIVSIALDSNLQDMSVWVGGLLFAAAAVLTAQGLSRYVAIRTSEVIAAMEAKANVTEQPAPLPPIETVITANVTEQIAPAPDEPKTYTAKCPACGVVLGTDYDSETNANRAIAAHRRSCSATHPELYSNGKHTESITK